MARLWLLPAQASRMALRMKTKPMPGTPSRHLPLAAISASKRVLRASMGSAAKLLMASTIRPLPCRSHTAATAASGFSTPVPVSQWMRMTWLMLGSACNWASTAAGSTGRSSGTGISVALRPII